MHILKQEERQNGEHNAHTLILICSALLLVSGEASSGLTGVLLITLDLHFTLGGDS